VRSIEGNVTADLTVFSVMARVAGDHRARQSGPASLGLLDARRRQ
jgi:hypothetical protein